MAWYAVEELETGLAATKQLLTPFDVRPWLVLGIIAFFVSGVSGFNPSASINISDIISAPLFSTPAVAPGPAPALGVGAVLAILVLVGLSIVVAIVFAYFGALLEFVFVEVARTQEVRIRGFAGNYLRAGLALLLFRIAIGIIVIGMVIGAVVFTVLTAGIFLLFLFIASPIIVLVAIGIWVIGRFTTDFVVPIMIAEETGILSAWERLATDVRTAWKQYAVYALVRALLGVLAGIVVWIGFATVGLVVAIPFALIGLPGLFLLAVVAGLEAAAMVWGVTVLFAFLVTVLIIGTVLVQVPVQTYLRYYALLVLGRIAPEFELPEDVRRTISGDAPSVE